MIRLHQLSCVNLGFVAGFDLRDLTFSLSLSPSSFHLAQGGWRRALRLPGREGVPERGGGHAVPQADPGWSPLPALQADRSLRPQGTSAAEKDIKTTNRLIESFMTLWICLSVSPTAFPGFSRYWLIAVWGGKIHVCFNMISTSCHYTVMLSSETWLTEVDSPNIQT